MSLKNSNMVLLFFISSLLGVAFSFFHLSFAFLITCALIGVIFFVAHLVSKDIFIKRISLLCLIGCVGFCVGQGRVFLVSYPDVSALEKSVDTKISVYGVVDIEPVSLDQSQKIVLSVSEVKVGSTTIPLHTKMLARIPLFPEFHYGDILKVTGTLKVPEQIISEDGRVFDYQMYLFKDGITHTLSFAQAEKVGTGGNMVLRALFRLRGSFVDSIQSVLPEPSAGLLSGILLGTDTLAKKLKDDFRIAGLSHIVVLSGYNITVVAESIFLVVSKITPTFASGVSFFSVILFVLMAGAGASAVRAGIMTCIALVSRHFGNTYNAPRALLFALWAMVMWNPFTLIYDPSFHLSVIATYGIMFVTPLMLKLLARVTERFGLRELCATTLGAQCAVLPYILYMSGNLSLFAFPANFLVLPFVPLTMLLGFFTALLGFVSRFLGLIFGLPTYLFLQWDILIAESVSKIPYASIHVPPIPLIILFIFYLVGGIFIYRFNMKNGVKQNPSTQLYSGDDSVVGY